MLESRKKHVLQKAIVYFPLGTIADTLGITKKAESRNERQSPPLHCSLWEDTRTVEAIHEEGGGQIQRVERSASIASASMMYRLIQSGCSFARVIKGVMHFFPCNLDSIRAIPLSILIDCI